MQDERLTPAERELETLLGGLRPVTPSANRDRVMFLAGQASGRRQRWAWQGVSCCLAVVIAVLVLRPGAHMTDIGPSPTAIATDRAAPSVFPAEFRDSLRLRQSDSLANYLRLRRLVRDRGLDALPPLAPRPVSGQEEPWTRDNIEKILSST
ncbi:MAG: hypothetical protein KBE65_03500 [Phycisphaerae bacterium]|nr:hypothetical protein [Phycisphaerae bacterium]